MVGNPFFLFHFIMEHFMKYKGETLTGHDAVKTDDLKDIQKL